MPSHLPDEKFPNQSRSKIATAQNTQNETQTRRPRVKHAVETIDWLGWWSLSIALSALVMAAVVYFNDNDTVGASGILAGAAGVVALVLLFSEAPNQKD